MLEAAPPLLFALWHREEIVRPPEKPVGLSGSQKGRDVRGQEAAPARTPERGDGARDFSRSSFNSLIQAPRYLPLS